MSLEKAKAYLENKGFLDHVIELADSTATVAMAAVQARRIESIDILLIFGYA